MRASLFGFILSASPLLSPRALATEVTFRVVDQHGAPLAASEFHVADAYWVQQDGVLSLSPGTYSVQLYAGILGQQTYLLYREESITIAGASQVAQFTWSTAPLSATLVDQLGAPIPASQMNVSNANLSFASATIANGGSLILPVTEDPNAAPIRGSVSNGYALTMYPGLAGRPQDYLLYRTDSAVELTPSGLNLASTWKTASTSARLVDQNGASIPASLFIVRSPNQSRGIDIATLLNGDAVTLPVTNDSQSAPIRGDLADGYALTPFPGLAGRGQDHVLFRIDPPQELTEAGLNVAVDWITAPLTVSLQDQGGGSIAGSQFFIRDALDSFSVKDRVANGDSTVLPVTEDPSHVAVQGSLASGYSLIAYPGIGGATQEFALYRRFTAAPLTAAGDFRKCQWIQVSGPLTLVDALGVAVPGSSIYLPFPFDNHSAVHNGDVVAFPITDNAIYGDLAGAYANGYPINVVPGDLAGVADTFEFELQSGGAFMPASFAIDSRTYSLVFQSNRPPTADAGANLSIASFQQSGTTISGTASDPDGNALTYRWLEGANVLLGSTAVPADGVAALALGSLPPLAVGVHVLSLEVNDGSLLATSQMKLTVGNSAPTATCGGAGTYQLGLDDVVLTGTVADFDGDTLSWQWAEGAHVLASGIVPTSAGGTTVALPNVMIPTGLAAGELSAGTHALALSVSDGLHAAVICDASVQVIDTLAPTLAPAATPAILWPPNHNMIPVFIVTNATDYSGGPILLTATVASSEDAAKDGSGHTIPDFTTPVIDPVNGTISLQLRAERSGRGPGRTYTITITATDLAGNHSTTTVKVIAPHDRG
jgi:hypothetical protein